MAKSLPIPEELESDYETNYENELVDEEDEEIKALVEYEYVPPDKINSGGTTRLRFTPEIIENLLESSSHGCNNVVAARRAGISYETLNRWLSRGRRGIKGYAEFAKAYDKADADYCDLGLRKIREKVEKGNTSYFQWLAERKKDWGLQPIKESPDVSVEVKVSAEMQVVLDRCKQDSIGLEASIDVTEESQETIQIEEKDLDLGKL